MVFKRKSVTIGDSFHRLTVVQEASDIAYPSGERKRRIECLCDCGKYIICTLGSLKSGNTRSCGCISSEALRKRNTSHGMTGIRPYRIWKAMKTRCNNPNGKDYSRYGGRGITICPEWSKSFEHFWVDMRRGYKDGLTIDRIDNDKGYFLKNCRWATRKQQANNTCRTDVRI